MAKARKTKTDAGTANAMRGNLESSEYKHVVLGLIFLKDESCTLAAIRPSSSVAAVWGIASARCQGEDKGRDMSVVRTPAWTTA